MDPRSESGSENGWRLGTIILVVTGLTELCFLFVLYHAMTDVRGNGRDWFVHHTGVTALRSDGTGSRPAIENSRGGNG